MLLALSVILAQQNDSARQRLQAYSMQCMCVTAFHLPTSLLSRLLTDDKFASNVPEGPLDGVNSLACRNEDLPPSPERGRSPSLEKEASKQQQGAVGPAVKQLLMDDTGVCVCVRACVRACCEACFFVALI